VITTIFFHRRPARAGAKARAAHVLRLRRLRLLDREHLPRQRGEDFQRIKLRQRVAVNMENRSTADQMVGQDGEDAGGIAPVG
jgi:hypothetical protein